MHEIAQYNIEYAHIYTSQTINDEHRKSIDVLKQIKRERESYVQAILIDDYNEPESMLDIGGFIDYLKKRESLPDYIVMESDLVPLAEHLLLLLSIEKRLEFEKHFEKLGKINCSFLVSVWQLTRLGKLPMPKIQKITLTEKPFVAEKTLTILPRHYERNEQKALDIIKFTPFADCVKNIEYTFFDY